MLPSKRFTPSRWELLSRPLRELPCPFLCAMRTHPFIPPGSPPSPRRPRRLENDLLDRDARIGAAMPLGPPHPLAPLLLEDPDLRAPRHACLLYTSDAADESRGVDLGGR